MSFDFKTYNKKYYEANKDGIKARRKEYHISFPEKSKQYGWKRQGIINSDKSVFTQLDFDRLYQIQSGKCGICGKHQSEILEALCVDHNHQSGEVRGLLCHNCNKNVGILENKDFVLKAQAYLEKGNPLKV